MSEQHVQDLERQLAELRGNVERIERLHRRAETMLASMHHRIRNILAAVRALAEHTAEHAHDIDDFTEHFDGRISALARCQSILARSGGDVVDLEELLREELLSHALEHSERITLTGDGVQLGPRTAEALALALHELTTNALRFGALSAGSGELAVSWRTVHENVSIDWWERGAPGPVQARRVGFGRDLIERGLPFQLGAQTSLDFTPSGVHCQITAKAKDNAPEQPA